MLDKDNEVIINFGFIGKLSSAHIIALAVTRGERTSNKAVLEQELLHEIKKTEVGKRLKDA